MSRCLLFLFSVFFLSGCSGLGLSFPADRSGVVGESDVVHTIQYPGETLSLISKWYTGREENWHKVLAYNPGMDEKRLRLGERVAIPAELVARNDAMPEQFLQERARLSTKVSAKSGKAPEKKSGKAKKSEKPAAVASVKPEIRDQTTNEIAKTAEDQKVADTIAAKVSDIIAGGEKPAAGEPWVAGSNEDPIVVQQPVVPDIGKEITSESPAGEAAAKTADKSPEKTAGQAEAETEIVACSGADCTKRTEQSGGAPLLAVPGSVQAAAD